MKYKVTVGNIGTVVETNNKSDAMKIFNEYVRQSKNLYGRAANEDVVFWQNEEPAKDFFYNYWVIEKVIKKVSSHEESFLKSIF